VWDDYLGAVDCDNELPREEVRRVIDIYGDNILIEWSVILLW